MENLKPVIKNERALVLAGGGAKGAFQIGVWKAFEKTDLFDNVTAIVGTSVGALNAVLFALGDCKRAEDIWLDKVSEDSLKPLNLKAYKRGVGIYSRGGLAKIIDELPLDEILKSKKKVYVSVTPFFGKTRYHELQRCKTTQEIKQNLLASSAIPLFYPAEKIRRTVYVDGAFSIKGVMVNKNHLPVSHKNNIPIYKAYYEGYRDIIVIALDNSIKKLDFNKCFPDCKFTIFYPKEPLGSTFKFEEIREKIWQGENNYGRL